jgi:hypothetical protein
MSRNKPSTENRPHLRLNSNLSRVRGLFSLRQRVTLTTQADCASQVAIHITKYSKVEVLWPKWLWLVLSIVAIIDTIWLAATPLSISPISYYILYGLAPLVPMKALMILRPALFRGFPRSTAFAAGLGMLTLSWPILRIYNHLMMSTAFPLADAWLAQADLAIGFDWNAYALWADRHLSLLRAMQFAYSNLTNYSIATYLLLVIGAKPLEACSEYLILFALNAIVCATLGCLAPALTASVFYDGHIGPFQHLPRHVGVFHLESLMAIRSDHCDVDRANDKQQCPRSPRAINAVDAHRGVERRDRNQARQTP